jgi:predicted metal-binding protein
MPPKKAIGRKTPSRAPRRAVHGAQDLERMFAARGFSDFRWIDPREIVVAEWVRMKCLYGCVEYGKNAACPPNAPSV